MDVIEIGYIFRLIRQHLNVLNGGSIVACVQWTVVYLWWWVSGIFLNESNSMTISFTEHRIVKINTPFVALESIQHDSIDTVVTNPCVTKQTKKLILTATTTINASQFDSSQSANGKHKKALCGFSIHFHRCDVHITFELMSYRKAIKDFCYLNLSHSKWQLNGNQLCDRQCENHKMRMAQNNSHLCYTRSVGIYLAFCVFLFTSPHCESPHSHSPFHFATFCPHCHRFLFLLIQLYYCRE